MEAGDGIFVSGAAVAAIVGAAIAWIKTNRQERATASLEANVTAAIAASFREMLEKTRPIEVETRLAAIEQELKSHSASDLTQFTNLASLIGDARGAQTEGFREVTGRLAMVYERLNADALSRAKVEERQSSNIERLRERDDDQEQRIRTLERSGK